MIEDCGNIEKALRQAFFQALPQASTNTAFENQKFDPSGKTKWFSFWYMPSQPYVATLGHLGEDAFEGIVQIDINIPANKGKEGIDQDISSLRNIFTAGTILTYANTEVTVTSCGRNSSGRFLESFFRFSVSINWRSRISRN